MKLDDPTDPREFRESVVRIPLPVASSFLISALASGIMVTMMSLLSLHMSIHGFALTLITLSVTFHVIGMYGLSLPFGRLVDTIGPKKVMTAGILMTGIGGLLTPLTVEYNVISAAIFLVGLGWSATNISSSSVISAMAETGARGRVLGLNDLAIGMASVAGPLFGGLVISDYGFFAWGLYGFLLSVPGFLLAVGTKFSPERFPP